MPILKTVGTLYRHCAHELVHARNTFYNGLRIGSEAVKNVLLLRSGARPAFPGIDVRTIIHGADRMARSYAEAEPARFAKAALRTGYQIGRLPLTAMGL